MNDDDAFGKVLVKGGQAAGALGMGTACMYVANAVVPGSGVVAAVASAFAPERAKNGAAVGAVMGAGVVGKAVMVGLVAPPLLPVMAIGAAIVGVGAWLFGSDN